MPSAQLARDAAGADVQLCQQCNPWLRNTSRRAHSLVAVRHRNQLLTRHPTCALSQQADQHTSRVTQFEPQQSWERHLHRRVYAPQDLCIKRTWRSDATLVLTAILAVWYAWQFEPAKGSIPGGCAAEATRLHGALAARTPRPDQYAAR